MITENRIKEIARATEHDLDEIRSLVFPGCKQTPKHLEFLENATIGNVKHWVNDFFFALAVAESQNKPPLVAFWMLANGRTPNCCFRIDQTCGGEICVNPDHLVLVKL